MDNKQYNALFSFIWNIANDVLVHAFEKGDYKKIILPFMVLPIYNVLIKIDSNVINAARDLGANPVQTFCKVIFPLSIPGVISGITMVFVPALTTFVISKILGGSKILLIGNVIEQEFTQTGNWNLGSGLSIVLMLFIIFNMVISVITDKEGEANTL